MARSDGRERIEVELVSAGGADSPFAPGADAEVRGAIGTPGDGSDRRMVVVASVVAVGALALGWILGRSAADTTPEPAVEASATVAQTAVESVAPATDAATTVSTAPPGVPSAAPAPVGIGDPTDETSAIAAPTVTQVEVAAVLAGQPLEIVAYGNGQLLVRLDLTTGRLVTQTVRRQPFGRPRLIVGDDWVMLPPADPDTPTIIVGDDGEVTEDSFGATWQVAGTSDGTDLWVMPPTLADGDAGTIERVPVSAGIAEGLALPGPPSRFDPRGGFVIDAPGGSYRIAGDGVTLITSGDLIAIGRDVALAEECDPHLVCTVVVIDRASGERRPLDVNRPLDDSRLTSIAIIGGESVAPDGRLAMVRVVNPVGASSGQPTIGVIDLTDGAVTEIGPAQDIDEAVWSPDGAFVFHNRGGKPVAYEHATGMVHVVADELIAVDALGVRPVNDQS